MNATGRLLNIGALILLVAAIGGSFHQLIQLRRGNEAIVACRTSVAREQAELRRLSQRRREESARSVRVEVNTSDDEDNLVSPEMSQAVLTLVRRVQSAKDWFVANPAQRIPEMRDLSEGEWITLVAQANLDTDDGIRCFASAIRLEAEQRFAEQEMKSALGRYFAAHDDTLPTRIEDLIPMLPEGAGSDVLNRYEMLVDGSSKTIAAENIAIGLRPDSVIDPEHDAACWIGSRGCLMANVGPGNPILQLAKGEAAAAYANAHDGTLGWDLAKIGPYLRAQAPATADYKRQAQVPLSASR